MPRVPNARTATVVAAVGVVAGIVAWKVGFSVAPFAWTGEPDRLSKALGLRDGMEVADIGAGSGALAVAMSAYVGDSGRVYATELSPEKLAEIDRRVGRASAAKVVVVRAADTTTGLPEPCCDAVYMRAVFHHVPDRHAFAASVARAVRPGGRVAVIDFAPGTLWFHGGSHGIHPEEVAAAFRGAGLQERERVDDWGGGMYMLLFERR